MPNTMGSNMGSNALGEALRVEFPYAWAILAAALASFLCVVIERLPADEQITGRSHCACGRVLRAHQLVPIASWVATAGRARCCGARIPVRYVLAETAFAIGGFLGAEAALRVGGAWTAVVAVSTLAAMCAALIGARRLTRRQRVDSVDDSTTAGRRDRL